MWVTLLTTLVGTRLGVTRSSFWPFDWGRDSCELLMGQARLPNRFERLSSL